MAWGAPYETPEEIAEARAQQDAALEAQLRAKLSQFERRAIDVLTDIAGSLKRLADNMQPIYTLDAESGQVTVQHGNPDEVAKLRADMDEMRRALFGGIGETSGSEGDVGTASAGPVTDPGPARPDDHAGRYSTTDHCGQLHEDEVGGFHECYEAAEGHRHRCLCGLTWSD